jgi:hypothetical protein
VDGPHSILRSAAEDRVLFREVEHGRGLHIRPVNAALADGGERAGFDVAGICGSGRELLPIMRRFCAVVEETLAGVTH